MALNSWEIEMVGEYFYPIGPVTIETYAAELELRQARADYRETWSAVPFNRDAEWSASGYIASASFAHSAAWFREW